MLWDEPTSKINNHWKLFLQVYVITTVPFIQINVLNLFKSYFPKFEDFRQNTSGLGFITVTNFFIDYLLTFPWIFLTFSYYEIGIYFLVPISIFLVHCLPFFCKDRNVAAFGQNPRRTIVELASDKYKFTFLDHNISSIFLAMCFAILLCDTLIFPDCSSKTTKDGIGSMDLGAGLILFTSGVTARQARGFCLIIGVLRSVLSEFTHRGDFSHGTHWNIFLIIAAIILISVFIPNVLLEYAYILAFLVALGYQFALSSGFGDFLLDTSRHHNFIESNAIGMAQTFGLLACYLAGVGFGKKLYQVAQKQEKDEDKVILFELLKLIFCSLAAFFLGYFVFEPTAPKPCNLAYVAYIVLIGGFGFLVVFLPDRFIKKLEPNMIYDGPAKSSRLIYFIVGNTLTGIVNFFCITEELPMWAQFTIVLGYSLVLHVVFAVILKYEINVRFW